MKNVDKHIFEIISILATYTYLKEKYPDLSLSDSKESDVKEIDKLLKSMQKLAHLPNKKKNISDAYDDIVSKIDEGHFDEEAFFTSIKEKNNDLSKEAKEYIVYAIMFVAHRNDELSSNEQEVICQVAHFLGLDYNIEKILSSYKNSEFVNNKNTKFITIVAFVVVAILSVVAYFTFNKKDSEIKMFNQQNVVFSKIHFNRFVVYKNQFQANDYFQKQVVFYLDGSAEVTFSPKNIEFNSDTKTITLYYKDVYFDLIANFTKSEIVDEIEPQQITESDLQKVGAIVGIAGGIGGAVVGAKAGNQIGKITKNPILSLGGGILGGAVGGATGYFMTVNSLEGTTIAKELTESEKRKVIEKSKELIKATLRIELQNEYKKRFEQYIIGKYSQIGIEVTSFNYVEREN